MVTWGSVVMSWGSVVVSVNVVALSSRSSVMKGVGAGRDGLRKAVTVSLRVICVDRNKPCFAGPFHYRRQNLGWYSNSD